MFSKKLIAGAVTSVALAGMGFVSTEVAIPMAAQEARANNTWVNDYIRYNNIKPVQIQNQEGTFNRWFGYRGGVGRPEGVVIHETATPNVGAAQYAYAFNKNWPHLYTYVHAFADDKAILNIHNTDYGVWGAGPSANNRYIQIELCEVGTTDQFARSISNDAYYTAAKLIQYGLPFIPGKTVLSHHDVSNTFGDTNHVDPDGYFGAWSYDMNQFYDLVGKYYNNLKATGSVDGAAQPAPAPAPEPAKPNPNVTKGSIWADNPASYSVPLMAFRADGTAKLSNRGLGNKTPWATDQSRMYNGHKFYRVSTNEWVEDTYAKYTPANY